MPTYFDGEAFYAALNAVRLSRQKTWKQVAQETGVNASTLTRIGQGTHPDVNNLAALLSWATFKAELFIQDAVNQEPEIIAQIIALLYADPHLSRHHAKLIEDMLVNTYHHLKDK